MSENWQTYKRKGKIELRRYVPGEDLTGISVAEADDPPQEGDMIARNPDNPEDQWVVNRDYFLKNYEFIQG